MQQRRYKLASIHEGKQYWLAGPRGSFTNLSKAIQRAREYAEKTGNIYKVFNEMDKEVFATEIDKKDLLLNFLEGMSKI